MPPIRTFRVLIEDTYADCGGSVFQTYSRHCIAYHPYDIRDRGDVVLRMRVFREVELFARQAGPKELPLSVAVSSPNGVDSTKEKKKREREKGEKREREKTVFPAPPADEIRDLPVRTMGGGSSRGCLEPLSQLDVLPDVPPLTLHYLMRNELQLEI